MFNPVRTLITLSTANGNGKWKWSIIHASIGKNCSDLQFDLFQNHLSRGSSCSCGHNIENASHFFFECENYRIARLRLFRETREFHPLSLEYILYGKPSFSNIFFFFFQAVHLYNKETKQEQEILHCFHL